MDKYIFLDNWVLSHLSDDLFSSRLSAFIRYKKYTLLLTRELLTELYNPNWHEVGDRDRGFQTASFINNHPSVIVFPKKVFDTEYLHFPKGLNVIPIELDLKDIKEHLRQETLLRLLRRDTLFLEQGIDIEKWSQDLKETKSAWLNDARRIVEDALKNGTLQRDRKGNFITGDGEKEILLTSLDLRIYDFPDIDSFLHKGLAYKKRTGRVPHLRGTRVISLCHWYAYVEVDNANKLKQQGSDIVDYYHMGLIPYCSAFTVDTNMYRLLENVSKDIDISRCELYTPKTLEEAIARY